MKNEWEIIAHENPGGWMVDIFIINKGLTPSIARIKKNYIELEQIKEGEAYQEPTLKLNMYVWRALQSAMTKNKVREKNEVEAELGATKYHLEDMRKLLKLNK